MDIEDIEYGIEQFQLGRYLMNVTTVAFLPIEQLMLNRSENKEISGQKLWCGSLCLIQYFLNLPELIAGANSLVVELGAGTGVLGMICSKLGAASVVLTDHDAVSIRHMKDDCLTNSMDDSVSVEVLDWYHPNTDCVAFARDALPAACTCTVVAGDVLYKKELIAPFFATLKQVFSLFPDKSSKLLLCHIPRAGQPFGPRSILKPLNWVLRSCFSSLR